MTEREWLACAEPLDILGLEGAAPTTFRKVRLFLCGCCRCLFWDRLPSELAHKAVHTAELYADDLASKWQLRRARQAAELGVAIHGEPKVVERARAAAWYATHGQLDWATREMFMPFSSAKLTRAERKQAAQLVRDCFGNPSRPVSLAPAWVTSPVRKLAQAAYDNRPLPSGLLDSGRLAILADALEEAGCTNQDLLSHLRGPGPHVRGCWAVDLLLGMS
jgi:hypothetical protein